jgi:hypothetical protein
MGIVAVVLGILSATILFALWTSDRERRLHDWRWLRTVLETVEQLPRVGHPVPAKTVGVQRIASEEVEMLDSLLVFCIAVFLSLLCSRLIKRLAERYSWDFALDYRVDIFLFVVSLLISVVIEAVRYKASQTDTPSGS